MNNIGNIFDEVEAELLRQFKAITPEQLAEDERLRKAKRDYEALHTAIEEELEGDDAEWEDTE